MNRPHPTEERIRKVLLTKLDESPDGYSVHWTHVYYRLGIDGGEEPSANYILELGRHGIDLGPEATATYERGRFTVVPTRAEQACVSAQGGGR